MHLFFHILTEQSQCKQNQVEMFLGRHTSNQSGFGKGLRNQCRQFKCMVFDTGNQMFIKSMEKLEEQKWRLQTTLTFKVTPPQLGFTGQETTATPPTPHPESGDRQENTESGSCTPTAIQNDHRKMACPTLPPSKSLGSVSHWWKLNHASKMQNQSLVARKFQKCSVCLSTSEGGREDCRGQKLSSAHLFLCYTKNTGNITLIFREHRIFGKVNVLPIDWRLQQPKTPGNT